MARKRTAAQIEAEAEYERTHEIVQINVKWKTEADLKMFARLRKRFPNMKDTGIVRMAVKELAGKSNK